MGRSENVTDGAMDRSKKAAIGKAAFVKNSGFTSKRACLNKACWLPAAVLWSMGATKGFPALGAKVLKFDDHQDPAGFLTVGGCLNAPEKDEVVSCNGLLEAGFKSASNVFPGHACADTWILN